MKQRGFTLVEMAIVLVIIGLLLGGILASQTLVSSTKAKDVVMIIDDLRTATTYFRQRYGYLPGDLPNPGTYLTAGLTAGTGGNNGDGWIDGAVNASGQATAGSEAAVAPLQLFDAGLIGKIDSSDARRLIKTSFGAVQIVKSSTADGLVSNFAATNPAARNAIVFVNLPCDVINEVDAKVDDGNLSTGKAIASNTVCTGTSTVAFFAVVL